jgi:MinD-like ATPase involved in chromosome partitioning or flagellar assembly
MKEEGATTTVSTKVIVIHESPDVQEWVGSLIPDWDVQIPVTSSAAVWDYLQDGSLSPESEILFISDRLYEQHPEDFAVVAASFAPTMLVIVIMEDPALVDGINTVIADARNTYNLAAAPYYYFDTSNENPTAEVERIYNEYSADLAQASVTPAPVETEASPEVIHTPTNQGNPEAASMYPGYTAGEIASIQNSLGEPGLIVASTSSKGGSGKTTVAMCTAIAISMGARLAAEQGLVRPMTNGGEPVKAEALKVCVVDMDVRDGQIGFAINVLSPSILTLYIAEDLSPETIRQNMIPVPRFEIDCLLAPKRVRTSDYLTPQFYLDVFHQLRLMYDLIVLDTSVNYTDPLLGQVVYPEADAILLVTNLSKGAVLGMPRWMEEVTSTDDGGAGVPKEKIGVVINQSLGGVGMDLDLVRRMANDAPLLVAIPADNRAVTKASNEGSLHELLRKHETIGAEYFKLASKVWRKTPLASPLEDYLNSPEKQRDDALAAKGKTNNVSSVATFTPLTEAPPKKRVFGSGRSR